MRNCRWTRAALATCLILAAAPVRAGEVSLGAGSAVDLGTGSLALGCADLTVSGMLSAGTVGFAGARDVAIEPGGVLDARFATLSLSGGWYNAGSYEGGGVGLVEMVDGCGVGSAVVSGSSTFANLSVLTSSGKELRLASGYTQGVRGMLTLRGGDSGSRLRIRSTLPGSAAGLIAIGGSNANYLDVDDNDASAGYGIPVGHGSVKGPNTPGWLFGASVPALGALGMLALAGALLASGQRRLSRRDARG